MGCTEDGTAMSGLSRKRIKVRGKNGKTFQRSVMVKSSSGRVGAGEFVKRHGLKFLGAGVAGGSAGMAGFAAGWRAGTSLPVHRRAQAAAGAGLGLMGGVVSHFATVRALAKGARHSPMQKDWARSTSGAKLAAGMLYVGGIGASSAIGRRIFEHSEARRPR